MFRARITVDVNSSKVKSSVCIRRNPARGCGSAHEEGRVVKCRVCGDLMELRVTDLPFKTGDCSIVILKALPVLQCKQCGDTELEHATMLRVDELLSAADKSAGL